GTPDGFHHHPHHHPRHPGGWGVSELAAFAKLGISSLRHSRDRADPRPRLDAGPRLRLQLSRLPRNHLESRPPPLTGASSLSAVSACAGTSASGSCTAVPSTAAWKFSKN